MYARFQQFVSVFLTSDYLPVRCPFRLGKVQLYKSIAGPAHRTLHLVSQMTSFQLIPEHFSGRAGPRAGLTKAPGPA
jgi:hypothetical protein